MMTRPDLAFYVNQLSSKILNATVREVKDARRLVIKAKTKSSQDLGIKQT